LFGIGREQPGNRFWNVNHHVNTIKRLFVWSQTVPGQQHFWGRSETGRSRLPPCRVSP
jgi:hypothetical protein